MELVVGRSFAARSYAPAITHQPADGNTIIVLKAMSPLFYKDLNLEFVTKNVFLP